MPNNSVSESNMSKKGKLTESEVAVEFRPNDVSSANDELLGEEKTSSKPFDIERFIGTAFVASVFTFMALGILFMIGLLAATMPALYTFWVSGMMSVTEQVGIAGIGFISIAVFPSLAALGIVNLYRSMKSSGILTAPVWLTVVGFCLVGLSMCGLLLAFGVDFAMASVAVAFGAVATVSTAGAVSIGMAIVAGIMGVIISLAVYFLEKSRSGSREQLAYVKLPDGSKDSVNQGSEALLPSEQEDGAAPGMNAGADDMQKDTGQDLDSVAYDSATQHTSPVAGGGGQAQI